MFKTLIFRSRDLHLKSFLNPRFYSFFPVPYTMVPWRNAISSIHNWIVCCSTICVHIVFTQIRSGLISLQWQSIYERTHKVIKGAVLKTTDQVWVLVLKLRHEQDRVFLLWWFSGEEMKVNDGGWYRHIAFHWRNITDQRLLGLVGQRSEPQPPRLWGTRLLHFPIIESMGESLQFVIGITNSNHHGQLCQLQSHLP